MDKRSDIRGWFFAARMRPGTSLGEGVRIGNFVGTTAAVVEVGVKVNHPSHVSAGAITCNYDGFSKHKTLIGDGAFVGTNSSPVAPVKIGKGAHIADRARSSPRMCPMMRWRGAQPAE